MTSPEAAELEAVDAALADRPVDPRHAELAELALLLRDDRPQPTATWAAKLDRKVEQGFPARPRRRLRINLGWMSPIAAVAGLLLPLVVIGLIASSGGDQEDAGTGASGESAPAISQEDAGSSGAAEPADDAGAGQAAPESSAPPLRQSDGDPGSDARRTRSVERSAALTLATPPREIDGVASGIGRVASSLGGFVSASSITSSDGGTLDLRLPSSRLDDAIERISRLADVRRLSRESLDITSSVASARERLNDARAERKSLLRQLEDAVTVNETESIRARLRTVSREIARARTQLRRVNNRARFANVEVTLVAERGGAEEGGAWTAGDALDDAVRVLEVAAAVLVIAVLLPLGIAALLAWLAHRALIRRRRERALDMA
jgi:hypothetical protein